MSAIKNWALEGLRCAGVNAVAAGCVVLALSVVVETPLAAQSHQTSALPAQRASFPPPPDKPPQRGEIGLASWYGEKFHGRVSASGEVFDQNALTAAHPEFPFDTKVRVTSLHNGQSVVLRINDRGPYADERIIDVSRRAARELDFLEEGVAKVRVELVTLPD